MHLFISVLYILHRNPKNQVLFLEIIRDALRGPIYYSRSASNNCPNHFSYITIRELVIDVFILVITEMTGRTAHPFQHVIFC